MAGFEVTLYGRIWVTTKEPVAPVTKIRIRVSSCC